MRLQQDLATDKKYDKKYMARCLQLAKSGIGYVAPNPMVGAVLVYEQKIIGEGFHRKYGEPHAEVNCINSVNKENKSLIDRSTMYVSLEPCSHYGKTPPCTDLILKNNIKKVVIGCKDINEKVSGRGIRKLQEAGVNVVTGVLEKECIELNKRFFTFHQKKRPYIVLKWAQSEDRKIGYENGKRVLISNEYSNRLVHKWRSEEAAIMVGTRTAIMDNPSLTARLWKGKNPVRILIDNKLALPSTIKLFDTESETIVINTIKNSLEKNIEFIKIEPGYSPGQLLVRLYESEIQSILVEGGAKTLQLFIDNGLWDEARIITNKKMTLEKGIDSPKLKGGVMILEQEYENDSICYYNNNRHL